MRTGSRVDLGLLVIRIGLGATIFALGSQKLFGWFGGRGFKAPRLEWDTWATGPHASLTVAAPDGPDATSRPAVTASTLRTDARARPTTVTATGSDGEPPRR